MVKRENKIIIVTGPESTGKTSITKYLAQKYSAGFCEEYARSYISKLNNSYAYSDIEQIAEFQKKQFDNVLRNPNNKIWFIDTYLIITKVWMLWHADKYSKWIDEALSKTKSCLYLLCSPDIEWFPDDVRENGGENRNQLFDAYKTLLEAHNLNFAIVKGENDERNRNAVSFVEEFLGK